MYSRDFRKLALRILREKGTYRKAAATCKVSLSTLHRWSTQGIDPGGRRPGRPRRLSEQAAELLQSFLCSHPVTTVHQMRRHLLLDHGLKLGRHAVRAALRNLHVSRKRTAKRNSSNTADPGSERAVAFRNELLAALRTQGAIVVSLDECYFSEKTLPLYGYSAVGRPCVVRSPTPSWKQRSLLMGIGSDGSKEFLIVHGSIHGSRFQEFIQKLPYPPGSTLLMDNASIHKGPRLQAVLKTKGYLALYTPPYSPEYNPIENVFSAIKGRFRNEWPWVSGVDAGIARQVQETSPEAIGNTFRHLQKTLAAR